MSTCWKAGCEHLRLGVASPSETWNLVRPVSHEHIYKPTHPPPTLCSASGESQFLWRVVIGSGSGTKQSTQNVYIKAKWNKVQFFFQSCSSHLTVEPSLPYPGSLQASRALMVVSIIVTSVGLGVCCMGMKCTTCGGDDKVRKARIAMTGGIIVLVGCKKPLHSCLFSFVLVSQHFSDIFSYSLPALCSIIACSWYANDIIKAFYNPFTPVNTK